MILLAFPLCLCASVAYSSFRRAKPLLSPFRLASILPLAFAAQAAAWADPACPFRRPIDINWDVAKGEGLAMVDFHTAGHARPDGAGVRVAAEDGKVVPSRVLMTGPGDRLRVLFKLVAPHRKYHVYFGNPAPPQPPADDGIRITAGLLMEMRPLPQLPVENVQQLAAAWEKAGPAIGRTMLDRASIGINPFGDQQQTISRMVGTLNAPVDGEYTFAMSADDRGAVLIDGKPVLFANAAPSDARINAKATLRRGPHAIVVYHANLADDGRLVVAWSNPGPLAYGVVGRESVGFAGRPSAGPLERRGKPFTADFAVAQEGECFFADGYSHRFRFTAHPPPGGAGATYAWDFGDGATSDNPSVQRLYLADGVYPVRLTVRVGNVTDTQTVRVTVSRDWERSDKPPEDPLPMHAGMAEGLDVARIPAAWAPRYGWLQLRAGRIGPALRAAARVAGERQHANADASLELLREVTRDTLLAGSRADANGAANAAAAAAVQLWRSVPAESNLQPRAAAELAQVYLWHFGDSPSAAKTLAPHASAADVKVRRLHAQALLLGGQAETARAALEAIPAEADAAKRAAISGASARTIEFHLTQGDWQAGDEAWERWQERCPADFSHGHAVALKVKLMVLKKAPLAAARVAEAFALAVPTSAYSPGLLDAASRLLADADPAKSAALRKLLKERYPEAAGGKPEFRNQKSESNPNGIMHLTKYWQESDFHAA